MTCPLGNIKGDNSHTLFTASRLAHRMAGIAHNVMSLLLFSFIRLKGEDGLNFTGGAFDVVFRCEEDLVCFHLWNIGTSRGSDYVVIAVNGAIKRARSERDNSKCALQIEDLTDEDVGRHRCQKEKSVSYYRSILPDLILMPGKRMRLQCVLLSYVEQTRCKTQTQLVSLTWVDESGAQIQEDSHHQIRQNSLCASTLIVTSQSPGRRMFRCQAAAGYEVQTSVEFWVTAPALNGKGRGLIVDANPGNEGGSRNMIGTAVAVAGCVVLAALVAAFVVKRRRRMRAQPSDESLTNNNATRADDVIYADVVLPVGSNQVWPHESTEYACVRYQ